MSENNTNHKPVNLNDTNSELEKLNNALSTCEKERDEYLNGWKRAKADLANHKKEEETRALEIVRFSRESIMAEILNVLDSFDLGLMSWKGEGEDKKGMEMIHLQLEDTLKKFGLERIKVVQNDNFNPTLHECIAVLESDGESGKILEEVSKGYTMHGKVVRPARVKVTK